MSETVKIPAEFRKREDVKAWVLVLTNVAVVVASGTIAWHIATWWAYVMAFVLVGARGQACYVLQHEAMHNLLFTKLRTNERVGVVLSALLGTQFYLGRKIHWEHHWHVGDREDPNRFFHDVAQRPPGMKTLVFFLSNLAGSRLLALARNMCRVLLAIALRRPAAAVASAAPALAPEKAKVDLLALLSVQLVMLAILSIVSSPIVYFAFYLIPLSTLTAFFELTRSFSEHVLPGEASCEAEEKRRFYMNAGRIECFFISQFDFHYHHVHHLHPNVVTFKVRALHSWLLLNDAGYAGRFKVRPGFIGTVWRYFRNRPFEGAGGGFPAPLK